MPHPSRVPLDQWPDGWLIMTTASFLGAEYIMMHEHERKAKGLPASIEERREFVRKNKA